MIEKTRTRSRKPIDKSALVHGEPHRIRSQLHLDFIRGMRCVVPGCGRRFVQTHHLLQCNSPKARGEKAADENCVPLCVFHHFELHHLGNESKWAERHGIDLVATARDLWRRSPANKRMKCPGESE